MLQQVSLALNQTQLWLNCLEGKNSLRWTPNWIIVKHTWIEWLVVCVCVFVLRTAWKTLELVLRFIVYALEIRLFDHVCKLEILIGEKTKTKQAKLIGDTEKWSTVWKNLITSIVQINLKFTFDFGIMQCISHYTIVEWMHLSYLKLRHIHIYNLHQSFAIQFNWSTSIPIRNWPSTLNSLNAMKSFCFVPFVVSLERRTNSRCLLTVSQIHHKTHIVWPTNTSE